MQYTYIESEKVLEMKTIPPRKNSKKELNGTENVQWNAEKIMEKNEL